MKWIKESLTQRREDVRRALRTHRGRLITACTAVYLLLTAIVGACTAWHGSESREARYVARTALPVNHRVAAADLLIPADIRGTSREFVLPDLTQLVGKHLIHDIVAGLPIKRSDVTDEPHVIPRLGAVVVPLTIAQGIPTDLINSDTHVDVIGGGKLIVRHARVLALSCRPTCVALVELSSETAARVVESKTAPLAMPSPEQERDQSMDKKVWTAITIAEAEIPVNPTGLWTEVLDFVAPGTMLKIECKGTWTYGFAEGSPLKCGPDGAVRATGDANVLVSDAPVGAVVAKIGGSTAGKTDGERFPVGSSAVISLATDKRGGPLYLGINVNPASRPAAVDTITVTISEPKP